MLTIKELSQTVGHGVTPRMVRHYHQIGLLPQPARSRSNYRLYSKTDVQSLQRVVALKQQGFQLSHIKQMLSAPAKEASPDSLAEQLQQQYQVVLKQLVKLRQTASALEGIIGRDRLEAIRRSAADVVIADFQNCKTADGQRQVLLTERGWLTAESEQWARAQIDAIRAVISEQTVLVVYVRGIVSYLNDAKFEEAYVLPANNQVTLVGHAGSGAYVAFGARQRDRR